MRNVVWADSLRAVQRLNITEKFNHDMRDYGTWPRRIASLAHSLQRRLSASYGSVAGVEDNCNNTRAARGSWCEILRAIAVSLHKAISKDSRKGWENRLGAIHRKTYRAIT